MSANLTILSPRPTLTIGSREIAAVTGKRHDHVLRDIDNMLEILGIDSPQFWGQYQDGSGRWLREARLPGRVLLILSSGYDVNQRARIVDRWLQLEKQEAKCEVQPAPQFNTPRTFLEALKLCVTIEEKNQALLVENEKLVPKAALADRLCDAEGLLSMEAAAKALGTGRSRLFGILRAHGVLTKGTNLPYQKFCDRGYFEVKAVLTWIGGKQQACATTFVTPRGLVLQL